MSYSSVCTSWNSEREGSFVDWNAKGIVGGGGGGEVVHLGISEGKGGN